MTAVMYMYIILFQVAMYSIIIYNWVVSTFTLVADPNAAT